ncbi:MAG: hypothetical protein EOM41_00650 [Bacilli bacterium]|nr:hypothetical protein [Bacilli bacterium]
MTRINVIPAELLLSEHLLAELREITRIPNAILAGRAKIDFKAIPGRYTLGRGHVMFFYNKLGYIRSRYEQLYKEAKKRGFNVTYKKIDYSQLSAIHQVALMNDYIPTKEAQLLNIERICERFDLRKKTYSFHGVIINDEYSFNRYLNLIGRELRLNL